MTNAKDVATVIQSALDEIGVAGEVRVSMGGQKSTKTLGAPGGDGVGVNVSVEDLAEKPTHP